MPENKLTRISIDVDDEVLAQVDTIAEKERWSRSMVSRVALENYLKLRSGTKEGNNE
jgi:predicted transcriptional regulator